MTYCLKCGRMTEEWDTAYYARDMLCIPCYREAGEALRKVRCSFCGIPSMPENLRYFDGKPSCRQCFEDQERKAAANTCSGCKKRVPSWEKRHPLPRGGFLCDKCFRFDSRKLGLLCTRCFSPLNGKGKYVSENEILCLPCYEQKYGKKTLRSQFSKILSALTYDKAAHSEAGD